MSRYECHVQAIKSPIVILNCDEDIITLLKVLIRQIKN